MTKPKKLKKTYIMRLSFDVYQLSQNLRCQFFEADGKTAKKMDEYGRFAGSYNFKAEDEVLVEIQASVGPDPTGKLPDLRLQDVNCAFVFAGWVDRAGNQPVLSPFSNETASFNRPNDKWKSQKSSESGSDRVYVVKRQAKESHPVTTEEGLWAMSGFLSVTYTLDPKGEIPFSSFFSFDPETSAGSGTGN